MFVIISISELGAALQATLEATRLEHEELPLDEQSRDVTSLKCMKCGERMEKKVPCCHHVQP